MSLLLEALKKAEDDMRRRRAGAAAAALPAEVPSLALAPAEPVGAPATAPTAPPQPPFPELSLAEVDEAPAPPAPPAPPAAPAQPLPPLPPEPPATAAPAPTFPPATPRPAPAPAKSPLTGERPMPEARAKATARFMSGSLAGSRQPARRTQVLGLAAGLMVVGLAGFWWWADQQASLASVPLARVPAPAPANAPAPSDAAVPSPQPVASAPAGVAGAPDQAAVTVAQAREPGAASAAAPRSSLGGPDAPRAPAAASPAPIRTGSTTAAANATAAGPSAAASEVALRRVASSTSQRLQAAHADYEAGRLALAAQAWRDILKSDPLQRDAWLGLAVLAHREGLREEAVAAYRQVLRIEPENPEATAALSLLTNAASDPAEESRLRELLARSPNSAMLNSALARMLSAQKRWEEAQPYWFNAHSSAPEDPSHAFNLAVSLDRLRKPELAASYYRKAIALAAARPAGFDLEAARARLRALSEGREAAERP